MQKIKMSVLLMMLITVLFGVIVGHAQTAPTVNGLFYGDGDYDNYYFLMRGTSGRGDVYYNLLGDTLYLLMLVDEIANDNVFGTKKDDGSYMASAGWSAVHSGDRLIGSDHLEVAVTCGDSTWSWWQDYIYEPDEDEDPNEADWLSSPFGPDGGGTPPPGLISSASSMQWNMNNTTWDVTLGGDSKRFIDMEVSRWGQR
ncbi:MAG: hypothetical protein JSV84_08240 [Gemmatimonadota bacterium]|nr:MAG: hypothetical protein JSV84_08240 [Gemmatimonadota bacterium]